MHLDGANLTIAIALAAGVLAQCLARNLRFPAIVLLLALGVGLGPDGLGWVRPATLDSGLFGLVDFGVAVILFEGGLNLQTNRLRRQERPIRYLVTLGALVTLAGGAVAAKLLLGWSWQLATLFGSLVIVTGPTVVSPLLRDMRLHPRLKTVLEAEGVLIDAVGAILAVLVLQFALQPGTHTLASGLLGGLERFGFGIAAGGFAGYALSWFLRWHLVVPAGYQNIFTLGAVILLFHGCEHFITQSGIVAVIVAGMMVGARTVPAERELREFKDQMTLLLVGLLFVLLAADVRLRDVAALGRRGWLTVAMLIFVVRPLSVFLSTRATQLTWAERAFIAGVAPRGIVAAAIASLTAAALDREGMAGGTALRALVFLTIAISVVTAGLTAHPLAILLKLRLPRRNRVAILGAQGLGVLLGRCLRQAEVPVVMIDSDPRRCREVAGEGFTVVFGNGLDERTMQRAQFELVETAIGLTPNEHLNNLFARHATEYFRVPRSCLAQDPGAGERLPQRPGHHAPEPLFETAHDVERWDVRFRHGTAELVRLSFSPPAKANRTDPTNGEMVDREAEPSPTPATGKAEQFLLLAVQRGDRVQPMTRTWRFRPNDTCFAVVEKTERAEALERLRKLELIPLDDALAPSPGSS